MINSYFESAISFASLSGVTYQEDDPCLFFIRNLERVPDNEEGSEVMREMWQTGIDLCDFRRTLSEYLKKEVRKIMYNTSGLVGEDLSLDILSTGGGLKRLVKYPSSTIQVLGAEKSFFKHMTTGSPPPKHGVIFRHPEVSPLKSSMRGKVSRMIANKIAITTRADYLGTKLDIELMKQQMDKRIKQIKSGQ
ncbi:MAG: ribosomal biogenesis protein [Thermoplasmataceae archaeon]